MPFRLLARAILDRRPTLQWWWLIWVAAGVCVFLCGLALGLVSIGDPQGARWFAPILTPPFGGRDAVSILAMGVDDSEGRGLADTIIAAVVRPRSGEIAALSIPRDSRVHLPGVGVRRISEAHSFGGRPLTIETAELLLGFPFDYYIEVKVPGIVELVDALDGVEIDVEKRMYYRDRAQNLLIDLQPGLQRLDGVQAMGYVRFRYDAHGDLGRIRRQRKFLRAAAHQLLAPENVTRVKHLATTFVETVTTNLNVSDLLALKRILEGLGPDVIRIATLPGHARIIEGHSMIELDALETQTAVDRILWGQGVAVTVLNGTNIRGLAARTASLLEEHGCDIVEVGNAEHQTEISVITDHRGRARRAERVASWLGGGVISVAPDGDNPADVTVVLGRDMADVAQ
ncbi:MAG: LCP family protein [Armatimonadota bacterium]|nr:MAG: LCP family protein [Armatimonadota bacterium]